VAFLILLASGARRSEVHALSPKGLQHHARWDWVSIRTVPGFISKTQLRTQGATALERVNIHALSTLVGQDSPEDLLLCPVRALRAYLSRTQDMREGKSLLFISYQPEKKGDISKNTLSSSSTLLMKMLRILRMFFQGSLLVPMKLGRLLLLWLSRGPWIWSLSFSLAHGNRILPLRISTCGTCRHWRTILLSWVLSAWPNLLGPPRVSLVFSSSLGSLWLVSSLRGKCTSR